MLVFPVIIVYDYPIRLSSQGESNENFSREVVSIEKEVFIRTKIPEKESN